MAITPDGSILTNLGIFISVEKSETDLSKCFTEAIKMEADDLIGKFDHIISNPDITRDLNLLSDSLYHLMRTTNSSSFVYDSEGWERHEDDLFRDEIQTELILNIVAQKMSETDTIRAGIDYFHEFVNRFNDKYTSFQTDNFVPYSIIVGALTTGALSELDNQFTVAYSRYPVVSINRKNIFDIISKIHPVLINIDETKQMIEDIANKWYAYYERGKVRPDVIEDLNKIMHEFKKMFADEDRRRLIAEDRYEREMMY